MHFSTKTEWAELTTGYRERLRKISSALPSTLQKSYPELQKNVFGFLGLSCEGRMETQPLNHKMRKVLNFQVEGQT